jgi:flavin-dependent dehydrogenase
LFRQVENVEPDRDALTRIESACDGWWYTGLLPHAQRIVAYFTDVGTESAQVARQPDQFDRLLTKTRALSELVSANRYERATSPRSTAANSGHLAQWSGPGWLAVGDAATSFDPLSSQGLYTSLYHGIMAAEAVHGSMGGNVDALADDAKQVESVYSAYLKNRTVYYAMEQRWQTQPFWASRIE